MPGAPIIQALPRGNAAVAAVIRSFRRLTGGRGVRDADRPTLLACSGGADSCALALVLCRTKAPLVIAHVVHDLRPAEQALADRDSVRELAEALGKRFVECRIAVRALAGNAEANARRRRYQALSALGAEHGCRFVAVAHQADDQAETLLMRLLRGSGPRGLSAMGETRLLEAGIQLIRPMLGITRADTERLCLSAGWSWREDLTNNDTTRLRAAVRHELMPVVRRLSPGVARRLGSTAGLLRDAAGLIDERVLVLRATGKDSLEGGRRVVTFPRELLRGQADAVVGELLRSVAKEISGRRGADRLTSRAVISAVRAIRGQTSDPRGFRWRGAEIGVTAHWVSVRAGAGSVTPGSVGA